jgi:hypothetical protein
MFARTEWNRNGPLGRAQTLDAFHCGGLSSAVGPPGIVTCTWRRGGFLRMAGEGLEERMGRRANVWATDKLAEIP